MQVNWTKKRQGTVETPVVRSSKPRTSSPPAPTWLLAEIMYIRSAVFLLKSSPNICKKCEAQGEGKAQQSCCLCVCVFACVCVCVHAISHVQLFATPWIVAPQAPLSMGILQARILERIAISYSRGIFPTRDRTRLLHLLHWQAHCLYLWSNQGLVFQ